MSKSIDVPQYVADEFNRPFRHPSQKPGATERSVGRVFRLINEALDGIQGLGWEIDGTNYHSIERLEPYGFEQTEKNFIIYAEQRGQRTALAVSRITNLPLTILFGLFRVGLEKLIGNCFLIWCREV